MPYHLKESVHNQVNLPQLSFLQMYFRLMSSKRII